VARSSLYYRSRRQDEEIRQRLRALAQDRPRFGYRRLHVLLRRAGLVINHKRVRRLYQEEGLALRRWRRRKRAAMLRVPMVAATRPNHRWSMDFVSEVLATGRRIRVLTIVDDYTRECAAMEVDTSLPGLRVTQVLDRLAATRGVPAVIRTDNGPEFAGQALDAWAYRRGVKLEFIRPGKPVENSYVESFNGKLRDECLNGNWFLTLAEARQTIEAWRAYYNGIRPHSSLGHLTPEEFASHSQTMLQTQHGAGLNSPSV
jgi:putative transposase